MTTRPDGYCSVWHRGALPLDAQAAAPNLDPFEHAQVVRTCLCNSLGILDIPCDPIRCARQLQADLAKVKDSDHAKAALGFRAKQLLQLYRGEHEARATDHFREESWED